MELGRFLWWVVLVLFLLRINGCFCCWEQERIALLKIEASIYSNTNASYWNSGQTENDCCKWDEVECDNKTGRVIQLDLYHWTWTEGNWYLNASLFLPLEDLQHLDLSWNAIRGWVPNGGFERLAALKKLEVLDLSGNYFNNSVLSFLTRIASLKKLHLAENKLNGSIYIQEYKAFCNLEELYVNDNEIDNFVTTKDSNSLSKLQILRLSNTKVGARIFESLAAFPSLRILDIRENNLGGLYTTKELGALNNLEELYLDGSFIDNSFLHKVGVMASLNVLTMRTCELNGSLPAEGWCELRKLQELDLSNNNFEGILPSCMTNLTSLYLLDLSNNHLNGNIDQSELSSLTSLEYLALSNNDFLIPSTLSFISNFSNLKVLLSDNNKIAFEPNSHTWIPTFQLKVFNLSNCSFNELNSTVPGFLHYQYDLRVIDLSHNNLVGKFPNWLLENNTRLEILILKDNYFTGPFTVSDDLHPNISYIDISHNYLQGRIPTNFGLHLPNLSFLNMSKNAFQGSIPSSFGNLVSLLVLDLSNNNLSGTIPVHFTMGCYSLRYLRLSYNSFSGEISSTYFNLTNLLTFHLDNNHFWGKIPNSISLIKSLNSIDFSNNYLSGMLPTWIGNMSSLYGIFMANNQLEGHIPIELCKLVHLQFLDLSENNLIGSIPSCFNSSSLISVHLSKNLLSGLIPSAFQNNSNIVTLNLRDNYLIGIIPNSIGSLSSLSFLLLRENHLEGRIPIQLCLLHNLNLLDLSYNKFSGPIPHCLSNITFKASTPKIVSFSYQLSHWVESREYSDLKTNSANIRETEIRQDSFDAIVVKEVVEFTTKSRTYNYTGDILNYMSGIDLSCNRLVGEIPQDLGRISAIHAMNLSHNNLTGPIPTTFSNLKQIESLDLSYNNLNDRIPPQLIEMTSLAVFSVAHNNLSGSTPDRKNQFGTFDESSYEGNPLLCGPPLHNGCTKIGPPSPFTMSVDHEGEEGGSFMDMGVFYISFAVTYIIVLLGIAVVLYINPYWRRAWFNLIEVCINTCYCFVVIHFHKLFNFRFA